MMHNIDFLTQKISIVPSDRTQQNDLSAQINLVYPERIRRHESKRSLQLNEKKKEVKYPLKSIEAKC